MHKGWFSRWCEYQRDKSIREAKEGFAYWSGKTEVWKAACQHEHPDYVHEYLAEAYAKQKQYQARLAHLQAQ